MGKKGTDRGVILLFAIQDKKRRIETGYGLEGILPDSKVGVIGRSVEPLLQAGNYDQAISSTVVQVSQIIAADAGVNLQAAAPRRGPPQRQVKQISLGQLLIGAVVLFIVFVLLAKFAPSGTIGFLLGMFLGGGFGGGRARWRWRWWRGIAMVEDSAALAAGAPAAAAHLAIGERQNGARRLASRRLVR